MNLFRPKIIVLGDDHGDDVDVDQLRSTLSILIINDVC